MEIVEGKKIKIPRTKRGKHNVSKDGREKMGMIARKNFLGIVRSEESVKKQKEKMKGRTTSPKTLFQKGNQFGKLRKNTKHTLKEKIELSLRKIGKKVHSEEHKRNLSEAFKKVNPMKDPEIARKNIENRKKNLHEKKMRLAKEKWRHVGLTNPNLKKNWFKPRVPITPELVDNIKKDYLDGKEISYLVLKYELYKLTIKNILLKNNIKLRTKEVKNEKSINKSIPNISSVSTDLPN